MYSFFTKKAREIYAIPIIDFGMLAMIGFFAGKQELQMRREKKALEKANPGMKVTVKAYSGQWGSAWSWFLEEKKVESPDTHPQSRKSR